MKTVTLPLEFVKEAYKAACNDWKKRIEEHVPELAEPKTGWYWWEKNLVYYNNGEETYGFWDGTWCDNLSFSTLSDKTPATKEEVETALIAEAQRRGFKEGTTIKNLHSLKPVKLFKEYRFFPNENRLSTTNGSFYYDIFYNGKWAKIIEDPIPKKLQELIDLYGKKELKKMLGE